MSLKVKTKNDKMLARWTQAAKNYALRRGCKREEAEDFAQRFVMRRFVEGTRQVFAQTYVDWMRLEFGDSRAKWHKKRADMPWYYDDYRHVPTPYDLYLTKETRQKNMRLLSRHKRYRTLARMLLRYRREQIAEWFGVSLNAIDQKIRIMKRMMLS